MAAFRSASCTLRCRNAEAQGCGARPKAPDSFAAAQISTTLTARPLLEVGRSFDIHDRREDSHGVYSLNGPGVTPSVTHG